MAVEDMAISEKGRSLQHLLCFLLGKVHVLNEVRNSLHCARSQTRRIQNLTVWLDMAVFLNCSGRIVFVSSRKLYILVLPNLAIADHDGSLVAKHPPPTVFVNLAFLHSCFSCQRWLEKSCFNPFLFTLPQLFSLPQSKCWRLITFVGHLAPSAPGSEQYFRFA